MAHVDSPLSSDASDGREGGEVATGTIIAAMECRGGAVIASDTEVSVGSYVHNRAAEKVAKVTDHVYVGRSGSAPDAQAVTDVVSNFIDQHESELGRRTEVGTVANICSQMCWQNKMLHGGYGLMAALAVAGWDDYNGGQVYAVPLGGTAVKVPWAIEGSGSTALWSTFDAEFKEGMPREQAEGFLARCIAMAIARDSGCGGCIRLVFIGADGASRRFIPREQVPAFMDDLPHPQPQSMQP